MARQTDVLIIGAGMSGSTAALTLKSMNFQVQVIDKGRGFGGRMATRRLSECNFDHGAQFIRPTPLFLNWLEAHLPSGFLKEWVDINSKKTFVSQIGMSKIAKELLENIETDLHIHISKVSRANGYWTITDNEGHSYKAPQLLITAPLPQAIELLEKNGIAIDPKLREVVYRPFIILLAALKKNTNLTIEYSDFKPNKNSILEEAYDNKSKGLNCEQQALTITFKEKFSKENYDLDESAIYEKIYPSLEKHFKNLDIKEYQIKKWRYGLPKNFYSHMYYKSLNSGLYLAGDGFGGPHLEGAFRSGLSVAYIIKDDIIY